jgi:hypothetical protein
MKLIMKGKAAGKVKSVFSITQLGKKQIEKMKLSGSVILSDFDVAYDSIYLKTNRSKIDFALPNYKAQAKNTKFASATILTDNITAGKKESYTASLRNASVTFETSDVRDMTTIPDFICSFSMDSLSANMDTLSIAIAKPHGKIALSPGHDKPDQPSIILSYRSGDLQTSFGPSSFSTDSISFDTDILNDVAQKDIFLQWIVKVF